MNAAGPRAVLEAGILAAAVMQVSTITESGSPEICHVWFLARFSPDRLYFISRPDRQHSINLRADPRVAAGIALDIPAELGGQVRGVTLTGNAREVPGPLFPGIAENFIARWPRARPALTPATADPGSTPSRLYEISVQGWVLFDELNFPDQPRVVVAAR